MGSAAAPTPEIRQIGPGALPPRRLRTLLSPMMQQTWHSAGDQLPDASSPTNPTVRSTATVPTGAAGSDADILKDMLKGIIGRGWIIAPMNSNSNLVRC